MTTFHVPFAASRANGILHFASPPLTTRFFA